MTTTARNLEIWTVGASAPGAAARSAERSEAAGYHGVTFVDSECLAPDVYVCMGDAARATSTLKLATGVTNPMTRHPAVTAGAIATVHMASRGRAVLGIGRGDSALAYLGLDPAPVSKFDQYVAAVQGYLAGEPVDPVPFSAGGRPLAHVATAPESRLSWLPADLAKVAVSVSATGPKVMAVGGRHADRVTLAVGADPARIMWGIETVKAAAAAAGRPEDAVSIGAWLNIVVDDDRSAAMELARGAVISFARFSVMHGKPTGPLDEVERSVLERIPEAYEMTRHFRSSGAQAQLLTPEFADRYAILGPPEHCIERMRELVGLGLDHIHIVGPAMDSDRAAAKRAQQAFTESVLPAFAG